MKTIEDVLDYLIGKYNQNAEGINGLDCSAAIALQLLMMLKKCDGSEGGVLSAFSNFVCMDHTFRYNYGFFSSRISDFFSYLETMRLRLERIIEHVQSLFPLIEKPSSVILIYDEVYECTLMKDGAFYVSLNEESFIHLKKKKKEKYSLQVLLSKDKCLLGTFEFKWEADLNKELDSLSKKINLLLG